jgi:hypothetical protein
VAAVLCTRRPLPSDGGHDVGDGHRRSGARDIEGDLDVADVLRGEIAEDCGATVL